MIAVAHHSSFWTTDTALAAVVLGCAGLVTVALFLLLGPRLHRHDLRARVGRFTPAPAGEQAAKEPISAQSPEWADRLFDGRPWWTAFKEKVELARIERTPSDIVLVTALASLAVSALLWLVTGAPVVAVLALGLGPVSARALVDQRLASQRNEFAEQLPAHLEEIASAMRAGHSLVGGMRTIAASAVEPMRTELERVLADEQLGVPLDAALAPMAERMASDDVQQLALVAALHERTGGNMAAVLDQVAAGVRERMDLRRELRSLTAQARLSRWVVTLLPLGLLLVIALVNPSYERPLFHTSTGILLLVMAAAMVTVGSLVMRAIVRVEA
jgi:tight adherence protein B